MASEISSISPEERFALFSDALTQANERLKAHEVELRCVGQWPPTDQAVRANAFDARPDIDLSMLVNGKWVPIDIIYLRQMPVEPERLKSVAALTEDLFNKALGYLRAMGNPRILISEAGSKYDTSHLRNHTFHFDEAGYIRIDDMRVTHKKPGAEFFSPIKASDIRSHTISQIMEFGNDIVNLTDDFDQIRTDGRKGMYCLISRAAAITIDQFPECRRREAEMYEGLYIPLVRELPKR
jgi:hypothetical protein